MTTGRLAALLLRIVGVTVLVASGVYLLVYLYRWEWNRALISGLFFVAAEVALIGSSILSRVNRLERRVEASTRHADRGEPAAEATGGAAPDPTPEEEGATTHFAWLDPGGPVVFVPVLLGVGAILSGLAFVVERVAAVSGSLGGDAGAERRMRNVALPEEPLHIGGTSLGRPGDEIRFTPPLHAHPTIGKIVGWLAAVVASGVLLVGFIVVLGSLTRYEPGQPPTTGRTAYELQIELRSGGRGETWVAQALWLSCRGELPSHAEASFDAGADTIVLTVEPAVGPNDERRFVGCLEDAQLDRIRVDVLGSETWPGGDVGTDDDTPGTGPAA